MKSSAVQGQEDARNLQTQLQKQEEELAAREEEAAANDQDAKHYAAECQEFQASTLNSCHQAWNCRHV